MADLKFALWDSFPESEVDQGSSIADVYDRHIGLARLAEEVGYHSYFVIEHQNRELISSPSVYLSAVAQQTNTLRIGAMIWQLPFHHPLRLAEEVGMLDQLSHGRVEFGTGIGIHEHDTIWCTKLIFQAPAARIHLSFCVIFEDFHEFSI